MFFPLYGPWHSSTRAEAAALVLAAQLNRPIHVGIDNKAVVDKSNLLIRKARQSKTGQEESDQRPLKKHWQSQTDGDLWCQF